MRISISPFTLFRAISQADLDRHRTQVLPVEPEKEILGSTQLRSEFVRENRGRPLTANQKRRIARAKQQERSATVSKGRVTKDEA